MPLTAGDFLQGRYRIVARLGQGGMGAVYNAWDTRLDVPTALKEMVPQPGLDSQKLGELTQQFQQEAQVLARLDHPHLVRVTDFFQEDGNAYLVMDFVQGESMAELIRRKGALSEPEVLAWTEQLLSALAYCHSQGIIHRDVKPHNVLIDSDGQAILVDFGLVKLWDPRDPRTRTAIRAMGTPEYAPPEQYDAQLGHTDPRSDVYSLAATVYHALTGRAPETATSRMASPERFPALRSLAPGVSRRTESAVMKALALVRSQRWGDANEMADALGVSRPATPSQPFEPVAPPAPEVAGTMSMEEPRPSPRPRRRLPGWVWAVGGLVALAAVLGGAAVVIGLRSRTGASTATPPVGQVAGRTEPTTAADGETPSLVTPASTPTQQPTDTPEPSPSATALPSATASPTPIDETPTSAATSTRTPGPTSSPTSEAASPSPQPTSPPASGALFTFEQWAPWRRGDQPYGELTQTQEQVRSGSHAAKMRYDFPATEDDFVVFVRQVGLAGQPDSVGAWVYGDGSGHYLNSWIEDAQGEIWSVNLGQLGAPGWQQLVGRVDPGRTWPSGHVAGPENDVVDYPIRFYALVLDRAGSGPSTGQIYLDDVSVWKGRTNATATPLPQATQAGSAPEPTPTAGSEAPVSEGLLDFPVPTQLDAWEKAGGGMYKCTIIVRIQGGAPPFTVYQDQTLAGTTDQRDYPLVFESSGSTILHTIIVESADGQSISHKYYIEAPWKD